LVVAFEGGVWLGRREREQQAEPLAGVQGSMLGLLSLMLGFSFSLAAERYSDRDHVIVQEASAIGTAWLRCDLLAAEPQGKVRELLRR